MSLAMVPPHETQYRRGRLLVVEDDVLQQSIFKAALSQAGYDVVVTSDGLGAVCAVRDGRYDVVFVDYHLPKLDGLATARLIRDVTKGSVCPLLIALTGTVDRLEARQAAPKGVLATVTENPINLAEIISMIERYLDASPADAKARADGDRDYELEELLLQIIVFQDREPRHAAEAAGTGPFDRIVAKSPDLSVLLATVGQHFRSAPGRLALPEAGP